MGFGAEPAPARHVGTQPEFLGWLYATLGKGEDRIDADLPGVASVAQRLERRPVGLVRPGGLHHLHRSCGHLIRVFAQPLGCQPRPYG